MIEPAHHGSERVERGGDQAEIVTRRVRRSRRLGLRGAMAGIESSVGRLLITGRKSGADMARLYNISQPTVSRIVAQCAAPDGAVTGLESPEWQTLQHAYGAAIDIPPLLRQLSDDPRPKDGYKDEPWFSLWSALCHQGDVYSASYVAVPHVVQIALTAKGEIDAGFFLLPACIEVARATGRGPALAGADADAYVEALQKLHECAFAHASDEWSIGMAQSVAAALAASKGQTELAQAIVNLDDDILRRINAGNW